MPRYHGMHLQKMLVENLTSWSCKFREASYSGFEPTQFDFFSFPQVKSSVSRPLQGSVPRNLPNSVSHGGPPGSIFVSGFLPGPNLGGGGGGVLLHTGGGPACEGECYLHCAIYVPLNFKYSTFDSNNTQNTSQHWCIFVVKLFRFFSEALSASTY